MAKIEEDRTVKEQALLTEVAERPGKRALMVTA